MEQAQAKLQDSHTTRFNAAAELYNAGKYKEAEFEAREYLKKNPKDFAFNNLLGVVLRKQERQREALEYLKAARKANPKDTSPLINIGNVYLDLGDGKNAEEAYSQVVRLLPKNSEHVRMLARAYLLLGEKQKAIAGFRRSLALNPSNFDALYDLIKNLGAMGEFAEAEKEIKQRLSDRQYDSKLFFAKAWLLMKTGKIDEAGKVYEEILKYEPENAEALLLLGHLYENFNREKANGYFRHAVEASNRAVKQLGALCDSLNRSRYGSEAAHIQESYVIACEIMQKSTEVPMFESATLRNIFLRCVDYKNMSRMDIPKCREYWLKSMNIGAFHLELSRVRTMQDRFDLVRYHREWGKKVEQTITPLPKRKPQARREKIRVGFMSSDLRSHPVTYFTLPLLEQYDKNRVEVYCYSFYTREEDKTQAHIASQVDAFRWWPKVPDPEVAKGIAEDNLDILFELGGATDMNKLQVMAYRPAPVQASWLGYPHSAGLKDIDYILVDPYVKPEDPKLLLEKPFEVSETWVTLGRAGFYEMPINPVIPEDRNGHITFGTMNNPYKYTQEAIQTWAEILLQVPGSKFLFVRPEGDVPGFRANVEKEFAGHGITADRIKYIAVRGKHLPHYNDIDIALDTFPHVGGTTTCETIWMGVPAITLVGPAFFERLSYSNLNNAGLGELCAFNREEYIQKAVAIAGHKEKRKYLRNNLRAQIKNHPLGQTQRFTDNFYKKVEEIIR